MITPQCFKNISTYSCLTPPKLVFTGFQDFKNLISLSLSFYIYIFAFDFRPTELFPKLPYYS